MPDPLRRGDGDTPRIASLVTNPVTTDNRVIKTATSLRDAGAEVLVVGAARDGHPVGPGTVGEGVPVHRLPDFDLVALLPALAGVVRRRRTRLAARRARRLPAPAAPDAGRHTPRATPPTTRMTCRDPAPAPRSATAVVGDVWMRVYQTARLVWFWLGAVRLLRRWRPDVVHANDGNTLPAAVLVRLLTGARVVYDAHELWTRRNVRSDRWLAPAVEAVLERVGVAASAGVITVSPSIATWMTRRFRLRTRPTLVRNVPARGGHPLPDPAHGRLRELAGLSPDDAVVAYCGGLTTGRGLEETVDALTALPPRVHLVMLGYGEAGYVAGLLARAEDEGVRDRVHVVGPVPGPQVPAALADADVSVVYVRPVCLSYRFALPNKLFESMHAGLPVVAADLPDMAAVVREHGIGTVFDSPAELPGAIEAVLADPAPYRAAAHAAAQTVDWEHEATRLLELYARVLAGHR